MIDVFPTRVDTWFFAIFAITPFLMIAGAWALLRFPDRSRSITQARIGATVCVISAVMFLGVAGTARTLRYEVRADGSVAIAGGLLPGGIAFRAQDAIAVRPSHDPRSAAASSLDRVAIEVRGRSLPVLLSPDDRQGFCGALAKHNPAVACDPAL